MALERKVYVLRRKRHLKELWARLVRPERRHGWVCPRRVSPRAGDEEARGSERLEELGRRHLPAILALLRCRLPVLKEHTDGRVVISDVHEKLSAKAVKAGIRATDTFIDYFVT